MTSLLITTAAVLLISAAILAGTFLTLKKQVAGGVGAERDEILNKISSTEAELKQLLTYSDAYAAKGQLETLSRQLTGLKGDLEKERANLLALEPKLDGAQKMVEEKENQQQELKSAKEEDEIKYKELLAAYENQNQEAVSLEQRLASSLKNIDQLMSEVTMTADQKAAIQEMSDTLSNAGSSLRDLIMEYETLNERLSNLQLQLVDLEDEYTKLVEKQLGE